MQKLGAFSPLLFQQLSSFILATLVFCFSAAAYGCPGETFVRIYVPPAESHVRFNLADLESALKTLGYEIQKCEDTQRNFISVPVETLAFRANQGPELCMRYNEELDDFFLTTKIAPPRRVASYWSLFGINNAVFLAAYEYDSIITGTRGYCMSLQDIMKLASPKAEFTIDPYCLDNELCPPSIVLVDSIDNLKLVENELDHEMGVEFPTNSFRRGFRNNPAQQFSPNFRFPSCAFRRCRSPIPK
ncbi:MAG: hypothetical protein RIS36_1606 [Pseudomonadota bacterium]|jgi:hypothetical protein